MVSVAYESDKIACLIRSVVLGLVALQLRPSGPQLDNCVCENPADQDADSRRWNEQGGLTFKDLVYDFKCLGCLVLEYQNATVMIGLSIHCCQMI